jgi:hypothetical protein
VALVDIVGLMHSAKALMFSGLPKIDRAWLVTSILPDLDPEFRQQVRETGENLCSILGDNLSFSPREYYFILVDWSGKKNTILDDNLSSCSCVRDLILLTEDSALSDSFIIISIQGSCKPVASIVCISWGRTCCFGQVASFCQRCLVRRSSSARTCYGVVLLLNSFPILTVGSRERSTIALCSKLSKRRGQN